MAELTVCGVIPAAGRGSRLGAQTPKILLEVADGVTVWTALRDRLRPTTSHLHVVVSPSGQGAFADAARADVAAGVVSIGVQPHPTGMGDAIFGATGAWSAFDAILVVWGDQVNLSAATAAAVVERHRLNHQEGKPTLTLPVVALAEPYVEYVFDGDRLRTVRQSREGDACAPGGLSDIGVFCLSTAGLAPAWAVYRRRVELGATTGEVNFLPFLAFLSHELGWSTATLRVTDEAQARGINTVDDLAFARSEYARQPR